MESIHQLGYGKDYALGNICHSETNCKESFSCIAKINGKVWKAKQKMYASFHCARRFGYMTVSDMLETMHKDDLFDNKFPEFSSEVHILAVMPVTPCSTAQSFNALC